MEIATHQQIDPGLCGEPIHLADGFSRVSLRTRQDMAVDATGLVHGGFIFGLADYAAMIAVNHPNVVLGAADVTFTRPVAAGETVTAEARSGSPSGKKRSVRVTVFRDETEVFKGTFTCFVLDKHVLA